MAGITLIRPPPSLRSPVIGAPGSITSHGTRRPPPSRISMSFRSHHQGKKVPPNFGLRVVHTPAPMPVLGNSSRTLRGPKKNNVHYHIPRETIDGFTREFLNIAALVQGAFCGLSGGEKSIVFVTRAMFDSLVQRVMGLFALAQYQIWRFGWLVSFIIDKDRLLSQLSFCIIHFLLELILREGFTTISFGMWGSTLNKCGTDVTKLAKEGKFDPVIGREKQIDQVVQILSRRSKNSPCLIGDPGVGKTAIVEGLAQLIAKGDVPETIKGKKVISVDMAGLLAGQVYHGQFEARVKNLLREVKRSGKIILFIDEVHTLVGAGTNKGSDVANVFKPALARGELQCIGATTHDEYRKHIEKDAALERCFGPVKIPEPTVDETIGILRGLRERYEKHHQVQYADEALGAAAELSHKYIRDRFLPDKAIDLIDQAGSLASLRHAQNPSKDVKDLEAELSRVIKEKNDAVLGESYKRAKELHDRELELKSLIDKSKGVATRTEEVRNNTGSASVGPAVVTEEDIRHVVSCRTGVPVHKLTTDETNKLLNMEETLHRRVVGQDEAVAAICRAIRRARAGLNEPGRPIGSFVLAGPTGVGKTELAKAVAAFYYGSEDAIVRLDMSEFMQRHTVSRLIGSPPGYIGHREGGQLTNAVRQRSHTLILLDEIEKAHPRVFDVMLQILDDGRLTDGEGRTVDFRNTLIVMTSNIGGGARAEVKEIAGILLSNVAARVRRKGIELQVTEGFKERVVEEGFDTSYGVRPLKRAIVRLLEDTLADKMLAGEIKEGDSVTVDVDLAGNVVFEH